MYITIIKILHAIV